MTGKGTYSISIDQKAGTVRYGKSNSGNCVLFHGLMTTGDGRADINGSEKQTCITTMIYPNFR
jgi:hypothetical protein